MTGFRITDGQGTAYSFGGPERSFGDYVTHMFGGSALDVRTSWKIREIRSAYFDPECPPAVTLLGIERLAFPGLRVEIDIIAAQ